MSQQKYLDVKETTLEEWLTLVFDPPDDVLFCDWSFPTDRHRNEYVSSIQLYSATEIFDLLKHFLVETGSLGSDTNTFRWLTTLSEEDILKLLERPYYDRLFTYLMKLDKTTVPWEGITWVLELLPDSPKRALEAIRAYMIAHFAYLPDGRIYGLEDAAEIIRARFIGLPGTRRESIQFLLELSPRDFEMLIERLYHYLGYLTELTPSSKDGGRDIIAVKNTTAQREQLFVECKLYTQPVGVEIVRSLMGVVSSEKVNKGVLITTSRFTKGAKSFAAQNPRVELIDGDELIGLMNEHLGTRWPLRIERLLLENKKV